MPLIFEWDEDKAEENRRKHAVSFQEAATAFGDLLSVTIDDPVHSTEEDRLITMGLTHAGRLVVVVHVERGDTIRIVSARFATQREGRAYEEGTCGEAHR